MQVQIFKIMAALVEKRQIKTNSTINCPFFKKIPDDLIVKFRFLIKYPILPLYFQPGNIWRSILKVLFP
jgi:hypothetical protein